MPLLNGPALSTALLQLALQTQSQKVTAWPWAPETSASTCTPQPLIWPFHTPLASASGLPLVGLWDIWLCLWGSVHVLVCHRCLGLR